MKPKINLQFRYSGRFPDTDSMGSGHGRVNERYGGGRGAARRAGRGQDRRRHRGRRWGRHRTRSLK